MIRVGEKESGTTIMKGLHPSFIPIVASSGYMGTIILGSYLVNKSFQYRLSQFISFMAGNWFIFIVLFFLESSGIIYKLTLLTGIVYVVLSFLGRIYANLGIIFLGLTLLLYGIYDIYDIIANPGITDAGILAEWILEKNIIKSDFRKLSFQIGLFWYILGACIVIYFNRFLFFGDSTGEYAIDRMNDLVARGHVSKEVANWFLDKGKDLDGFPLSKKNIKYLREWKNEK